MTGHYDVIILGGGNAGLAAASVARRAGKAVLVIEGAALGGTCPLNGCVPKKVLVAATEAIEALERGRELGVTTTGLSVDWSHVIDRQREILSGTSESIAKSLVRQGIDLVEGRCRFVGPDKVAVDERVYTFERAVIATGSRPRTLALPGAELLTSSDELLVLREPPASLVFVGAGVIAFELGHVFARLGTAVTLLEVAPRPLSPFDADAVALLVEASRALGIKVHTGVQIDSVEEGEGGFTVAYRVEGRTEHIQAAKVAHGAGRVAWLDGLDLASAGVETHRGGVVCDQPFRSASNHRVFVAGDALVGTPQLSPLATYEGRLAGRALLGEDVSADYTSAPSCVFTFPVLATVGLTEEQASKAGLDVRVVKNDMTSWRSSRSYGERFAWAKVLVDKDDKLVGAHLVGHGAPETINMLALAMRHGIPASALREGNWAYPTFGSDLKYLLG